MENPTKSHSEIFSKRSGTLISTEFIDLGMIDIRLKVILNVFKDLITQQSEKAIRFEFDHYNGYDNYPETKLGSVDKDELEGLIKSLNIIIDNVFLTTPANYLEVNFRSRSGFKAGCYYENKWIFYVKLSEFDNKSIIFLDKEYAKELLNILTINKQHLLS